MIDQATFAQARWAASAVLGVAVVFAAMRGRRSGRSLLGAEIDAKHTDTTVTLGLAVVGWLVVSLIAGLSISADQPYWQKAAVSQALLVLLSGALLPFVLRSARKPTLSWNRRVAVAVVGGLVTYLGVSLIGDGIALLYTAMGFEELPLQENVREAMKGGTDAIAVYVVALVTAPFAEEVFYRGVLFPALAQRLSIRNALLVQAFVFGAMHFAGNPAQWPMILPIACVGLATGWLYHRTGSIWVAVGAHALFNAGNLAAIAVVNAAA